MYIFQYALSLGRGFGITHETFFNYIGDPEIGPPMGLTESGPILESVRFVKPANYEWRKTSQSVYRYALLPVDIKVDY